MEKYIPEIFLHHGIKKCGDHLSETVPEIIVDDIERTERPISKFIVQEALEKTGFGKFNLKITFMSIFIHTNVTINLLSIGYILPSAVCDFELTTTKKGILSVTPTLGTCIGALCWRFLIESKGPKLSLIFSLFLHGSAEICLSLLISNYWLFIFFKLISGFAAMGAINSVYIYAQNFQPTNYEKIILACLSCVFAISLIVLPLLAWAIIPLEFNFRNNNFFFGSWKLFLFIIAVPIEISAILLIFMPETPKHLAKIGHYKEMFIVLSKMYQENNGESSDNYIASLLKCGNVALVDFVNRCQTYAKFPRTSRKNKLNYIVNDFKVQGMDIIKPPYLSRLIILSLAMFSVSSATYSMVTWFPEIIHRFSKYELLHPNEIIDDCSISKDRPTYIDENGNFHASHCNQSVDTSVYRTSFFMGLSAIFPNLLYLLFVDKVGFRIIVAIYFSVGLLSTFYIFFANSFLKNIILACIFKSVMCTTLSILFQFNTELFPENVRILTSSIATFYSRLGIVFGNGMFAFLIDDYCPALIIIVAVQLSLAIILCISLRV